MTDQEKLAQTSKVNQALAMDLLDVVANDSENLERVMKWIAEDCVWVMEPGGAEYSGSKEIKTFIETAMSGRSHDTGEHKLEITKWFVDAENLCIEYTHGAIATGTFTAGFKGKIKTGVLRYCITYHLRDGKIDRVHEYITSTSWWMALVVQFVASNLYRLTMKKLAASTRTDLSQ